MARYGTVTAPPMAWTWASSSSAVLSSTDAHVPSTTRWSARWWASSRACSAAGSGPFIAVNIIVIAAWKVAPSARSMGSSWARPSLNPASRRGWSMFTTPRHGAMAA